MNFHSEGFFDLEWKDEEDDYFDQICNIYDYDGGDADDDDDYDFDDTLDD